MSRTAQHKNDALKLFQPEGDPQDVLALPFGDLNAVVRNPPEAAPRPKGLVKAKVIQTAPSAGTVKLRHLHDVNNDTKFRVISRTLSCRSPA